MQKKCDVAGGSDVKTGKEVDFSFSLNLWFLACNLSALMRFSLCQPRNYFSSSHHYHTDMKLEYYEHEGDDAFVQ